MGAARDLRSARKKIPAEVREYLKARAHRACYLESLGFKPFPWQADVVDRRHRRLIINGARQIGKSTIVASIPAHTAKFYAGSLSLIGAPTEAQANETMRKVMRFISLDPGYPKLLKSSTEEIELENGSRILVRSASPSTFRGYSKPRVIILDEASRIEDEAYSSGVRPMLTDNPEGELILISTPFGREGFFYETFTGSDGVWARYEVRSPYEPAGEGVATHLEWHMDEPAYTEMMARRDIHACYSPRHMNLQEQTEQLRAMKRQQYLQEYCCEFVERQGQVFSYDEIQAMFSMGADASPMAGALEPGDRGGGFFGRVRGGMA